MHTATQLDRSMFKVTIGSGPATREALLPAWTPYDRLGVVVDEPFGAIGCSHLIQLAITAFYDVRPERRAGTLSYGDPLAIYPEIYLFHVGGRYGDHSYFDFWPARKEVFLECDPRVVLDTINDRAITRLAVPDRSPVPIEHEWKEPAAACDRIVSAFAYGASGLAAKADVQIEGLVPQTEFNVRKILDPEGTAGTSRFRTSSAALEDPDLVSRGYAVRSLARRHEGRGGLALAVHRREAVRERGLATERYRRIAIDQALDMLASPGAGSASVIAL